MENNSFIVRLIKHRKFLSNEIEDFDLYSNVNYSEYLKNRRIRREIERWIENILISIVDICKIILSIEKKEIPDTYRKIVEETEPFLGNIVISISRFIHLRNIIVHEYLDIKWNKIENFLKNKNQIGFFIKQLNCYLQEKSF